MKIFVDVDETVCYNVDRDKTKARDYSKAIPNNKNIEAINRMYDAGHEITYWTARGASTGIDWFETTKRQLVEWGAKHHKLLLGKPHYDIYIDDKSINTKSWEKLGRCIPEL